MKNAFNAVHLAIDVQLRFYHAMPQKRRSLFVKAERAFANKLKRHNISTIWVAYNQTESFAFAPTIRPPALIKGLGLDAVKPKENEPIYVKCANDAFYYERNSLLYQELQEKDCQKVIITGMNTCACVADTILGARKVGLDVYALYDLMADKCCEPRGQSPQWHQEKLIHTCDAINSVHLSTSDAFLQHLKATASLPALPSSPKSFSSRVLQKIASYASLR